MKKTILLSFSLFLFQLCIAQDTIVKRNGEHVIAKVLEISSSEVKYKKFDFQDGPTYVDNKSEIESIKYSTGMKEHFEQQSSTSASNKKPQNDHDYYGGETTPNPVLDKKIYGFGGRYRYQNGIINEREMHSLLMNTNDKKIMGIVQSAKKAHGLQYIGFAGIPLAIAGLYCFAASQTTTYSYNPQTGRQQSKPNPDKSSLESAAGICVAVAIACPVASGIFKYRRMNYNRDAINLYNQKY